MSREPRSRTPPRRYDDYDMSCSSSGSSSGSSSSTRGSSSSGSSSSGSSSSSSSSGSSTPRVPDGRDNAVDKGSGWEERVVQGLLECDNDVAAVFRTPADKGTDVAVRLKKGDGPDQPADGLHESRSLQCKWEEPAKGKRTYEFCMVVGHGGANPHPYSTKLAFAFVITPCKDRFYYVPAIDAARLKLSGEGAPTHKYLPHPNECPDYSPFYEFLIPKPEKAEALQAAVAVASAIEELADASMQQ